MGVRLTARLIS